MGFPFVCLFGSRVCYLSDSFSGFCQFLLIECGGSRVLGCSFVDFVGRFRVCFQVLEFGASFFVDSGLDFRN